MKGLLSRTGLRRKLLLSYLTVFMIAALTMAWYSVATSVHTVYVNNVRTVSGMAERAGDNFRRKMEQFEQSITMCVSNEQLQRVYKNRYLSTYYLYRALNDNYLPFFRSLYETYDGDLSRLCVYSTRGLYKWSDYLNSAEAVADEAWFQEALARSGIHWSTRGDAIFATCRIDNLDSVVRAAPLGVLYMEVDSTALLDQYVYLSWPGYVFRLKNASGDMLLEKAMGDVTLGETMRTFETTASRNGWTLAFDVPEDTLRIGDRMWLPVESAVIAAGLVVLLALITVFTRVLLKGLSQLKDTMQRVNEGDLNVTVKVKTKDEIGALAETFNGMLSTIRTLLEKTRNDERRLASLEARALRAQIDPHFLYNTLSFINWKCIRAGQEDISDVIEQLSTFYRTCLNEGSDFITVDTEIANITAYINIQLRLHDERFTVRYDVPQELMSCRMPGFVLQPLVENAILHGLDQRREGGELAVTLRRAGNDLVFTVQDNGPGLTEELIEKLNGSAPADNARGYGVKNVNDRIQLSYGARYGISVSNAPEGGCAAVLRIPCLSGAAEE